MTERSEETAPGRGELARALAAIAGGKRSATTSEKGHVSLTDGLAGKAVFRIAVIAALARRGLICRSGSQLALTSDGEAWLRRHGAGGDPFQEQHRDLETIELAFPDGRAPVTINLAESPLGMLARRKDRAGRPFLTDAEIRAGEKLRADYTRGQLMPRLGANWDAAVATGRRGQPSTVLADGALAARIRVERAIEAIGPELAGVLVDVCCFLKGLETVEAERGWPVRSAKVVLKTALAALGRHYEPAKDGSRRGARKIVAWGTPDHRPRLG